MFTRGNGFDYAALIQKLFLQPHLAWRTVISLFGKMTNKLDHFVAITKALSDPTRVRMLLALRRRELCVCQITALFGLATSTISKHLSVLQRAGLAQYRKTERWVYYRLPDKPAPVVVREALDWVQKSLAKTDEAAADQKRLSQILKMDPADICRR